MQVTFRKRLSHRVVEWEVVSPSRRNRSRFSTALGRGDFPHDLERFVVEAAIGIRNGFWGALESGTRHRRAPTDSDHLVQVHVALAAQGRPTPAAEPLERFRRLWAELDDEGTLSVDWPSLRVLQPV